MDILIGIRWFATFSYKKSKVQNGKKCDVENSLSYSRTEILMTCKWSICVNPRTRRAHSVTSVTTINVKPSEESWYRFKNVIKKPNPPMSIIWMSIITETNQLLKIITTSICIFCQILLYVIIQFTNGNIRGYFSIFSLKFSSFSWPWSWFCMCFAFAESAYRTNMI